jgi:hypothetical protein
MALVRADLEDGGAVNVDIRGRITEAVIVDLPFYRRAKKII